MLRFPKFYMKYEKIKNVGAEHSSSILGAKHDCVVIQKKIMSFHTKI